MSQIDFTVEYSQGPSGPGQVAFTANGQMTMATLSGRLDAVGEQVVSEVLDAAVAASSLSGPLDVTIYCERTPGDTIAVRIEFQLPSYFVGGDGSIPLGFVQTLSDVPIVFTP